jgi:hypothetical protein
MAFGPKKKFPKINPRRLRRILEQHFEVVKERSNSEEVTICCEQPHCHDSSGNCAINLKQGLVHCWKCNYSAHATTFLKQHDIDLDSEDFEESFDVEEKVELEEEVKAPVGHEIQLPEGFTPLADWKTGTYARLISLMANRKHLYLDDFVEAGVGFTRVGPWEPFAIFPVYEMGKLVYYQGRTYGMAYEGKRTKKFPSKKDVPLGSKHWVYGYDEILKQDTEIVIAVESILNVLSLRWELKNRGISGVKPVAVFKHAVSTPQAAKLLLSPAKEICFQFDGDATDSAWHEALKLSGSRKTSVAEMPVGVDSNDDAVLGVQRFLERRQYSPINSLEHLAAGL